jgi:uncharacterized protein YdbL (DUF1318 family)
MKKNNIRILSVLLPVILICAANSYAQGIKERMKERLPVIVGLKNQGIIGENNLGYLEFIGDKKEKEDIISSENQDRKKVYEAIAKQQNSDAETVGKHRAIQIAEKADPGDWLQDGNGKWYQKK